MYHLSSQSLLSSRTPALVVAAVVLSSAMTAGQSPRTPAKAAPARLADGRTITVPLAWSWRLAEATPAQRARFELLGGGVHIHWPEVDEDLSVRGMLEGVPAPRPPGR